jgi:hypothetical protein
MQSSSEIMACPSSLIFENYIVNRVVSFDQNQSRAARPILWHPVAMLLWPPPAAALIVVKYRWLGAIFPSRRADLGVPVHAGSREHNMISFSQGSQRIFVAGAVSGVEGTS